MHKQKHRFNFYSGNLIDELKLPVNKKHYVFKWSYANVLFSVAEQSEGIASIHVATDKPFTLRRAIPEFCDFLFYLFTYNQIIGKLYKKDKKLGDMIERMGFKKITEINDILIYRKRK